MSDNTQQVIELVKIKQWYVPKDVNSYQILRAMKTPLLKIHRDFIPTLKLLAGPRGIRARASSFEDILHERLDKIGEQWKSKQGRTCKLTDTRLAFAAPATDRNRKAIASLEAAWAKFCLRWGFKSVPVYSEKEDRLRLVIDYGFDPSRNPVIESVHTEPVQPFELVLGNTKFKLTFMDKPVSAHGGRNMPPIIHFETFAKAGSEWKLAHTGTCVDAEIGDVMQMATALSIMIDRREVADMGVAHQPWAPVADQTRSALIDELRDLTVEAETMLFKLAQAPGHEEQGKWMNGLWACGRKIPRLASKLKDARILNEVTRQTVLSHLTSPRTLYPFFLQKEMVYILNLPLEEVALEDGKTKMVPRDLSPAEIDARAKDIWHRLLRIKAAWIAAGSMDTEKGAQAFKAAVIEPSADPNPSVAEH